MIETIKQHEWKKFILAAFICMILFLFIEIVPMVNSMMTHEYGGKVIDKAAAEQQAVAFAEQHTGLAVANAKVVHQSDKLLSGYLAKEKLLESYTEKYDKQFPIDVYQVNVTFKNNNGYGFVYLHMYNERIASWNFYLKNPLNKEEQLLSKDEQSLAIQRLLAGENYGNSVLESLRPSANGQWTATQADSYIGEAKFRIEAAAQLVNNQPVVTKYKPAFGVPSDYVSYVNKQDKLAGILTGIGYVLMSIVLCILAIIYAILYRKFTSFKYGIVLTIIFLATYIIMNLNMLDAIRASQGELLTSDGVIVVTAIITVLLSIAMAGSIYISIVAGDGLWKAQGRNVWPRFGQPGYGDYVWRSMGLSYLFAIILLGLQPLIFLGLSKLIGTWGTSDVTMSPYNMSVLWLMPVLAWAAAISEEAVFRFFGIGLFRRWFRHSFAAAILPTLFWALGHVTYPFYPATTRLIELMIIGLLFSFIFVRYGFITAMFTHAIFNSIAVGSSLLAVGTAPNIISAIFFILLPVLIAFIIKAWEKRRTTAPQMSG